MNLHEIIKRHHDEIVARTRRKVASRAAPQATSHELTHGVPLFLEQLREILRVEATQGLVDGSAMGTGATLHGQELLQHGFSIAQVVHDYGDLCQAVTELALDLGLPIGTEDFHTLNRCLDNAIASAVTEYSRLREVHATDAELTRQGFFAHELRNHLGTAMLAFQAVKSGRVGITGSTIGVLDRSLHQLRDLIDRSVSQVRLTHGIQQRERLDLAQFIDEMEVDAQVHAANSGLRFSVERPRAQVFVNVDRHLFASAISNVVQNAFKYTRPATHIWLRARVNGNRVAIEIEDECGGLPAGASEAIFQPFHQGADRSGLGLGLTISRQAIEANGGSLSVRDLPGHGCVFVIEMPLAGTENGAGQPMPGVAMVPRA